MKKIFIFAFVFLISIYLASAASFSRDMAARIAPGEDLSITFSVSGAETGKAFTVEDTVPSAWTLKSWDVTGAAETKDKINISTQYINALMGHYGSDSAKYSKRSKVHHVIGDLEHDMRNRIKKIYYDLSFFTHCCGADTKK